MRFWLLFIFFRRLHSLLGCCRSLEHRNRQQLRDPPGHFYHSAVDAQSPAHGVEDGIAERRLRGLGLVFCHHPTHRLILAQSERECEGGPEAVATHKVNPPSFHGTIRCMKVTILDDWFDTLRVLPCFEKLAGHEVTVWNDHIEDVDGLIQRLQACEALVLIRERTAIRAPVLERLPTLARSS